MGIQAGFLLQSGVKPAHWASEPAMTLVMETVIGPLTLVERNGSLCELRFGDRLRPEEIAGDSPLLRRAESQLREYLKGRRQQFDLPLEPWGTPFQRLVWYTLTTTVPFGHTISYGELAKRCDRPKAARAVGMANHVNPLPILIPCHRVIGGNGKLVGYGGGIAHKVTLLSLEGVPLNQ